MNSWFCECFFFNRLWTNVDDVISLHYCDIFLCLWCFSSANRWENVNVKIKIVPLSRNWSMIASQTFWNCKMELILCLFIPAVTINSLLDELNLADVLVLELICIYRAWDEFTKLARVHLFPFSIYGFPYGTEPPQRVYWFPFHVLLRSPRSNYVFHFPCLSSNRLMELQLSTKPLRILTITPLNIPQFAFIFVVNSKFSTNNCWSPQAEPIKKVDPVMTSPSGINPPVLLIHQISRKPPRSLPHFMPWTNTLTLLSLMPNRKNSTMSHFLNDLLVHQIWLW